MNIKETLEVLAAVEVSCDAVVSACADGKIGLTDARFMFAPAKAAVVAAQGKDKVTDELKDLDEAEVAELVAKAEVLVGKVVAVVEALSLLKG